MSVSCKHGDDTVDSESDEYHDFSDVDDNNHGHCQLSKATTNRKRRFEEVIPQPVCLADNRTKRMKLNHDPEPVIETLEPSTEIVKALSYCFAEIEKPRAVSFCDVAELPTTVGLRLDGVGSVPLPICQEQLCKLKTFLAPDANTCTLPPQQWYFAHPAWNDKMRELVQSAAMKLGIVGDDLHAVEAHLDGLILCFENGKIIDQSKSHDSHRNNDCFATLIVQLPSEFSMQNHNQPVLCTKHRSMGGDTDIVHHFGVGDCSCAYQVFYAAYFNDCYSVTNTHYPISRGLRVCLSYRLRWRGPRDRIPIADPSRHLMYGIADTLQHWDGKGCIAMGLKYQYTESDLTDNGFGAFQPTDAARVRALKQARENVVFFVARMDRRLDAVSAKWLSEDGKAIKFGQYFRINLSQNCLCHEEHDDDDDSDDFYTDSAYHRVKNHNRWVVVMMKETEQFEQILQDSVEDAFLWTQMAMAREPDGNFYVEMKRIVEKVQFDDSQLSVNLMELLANKAYYDLAAKFVKRMTCSNQGLHIVPNMNHSITALIAAAGWRDPIRSAIFELMDCMIHFSAEIRPYCEFMQALKGNDCVSLSDPEKREVLICGWARLNSTRQQFAFVSAELVNIVDGMYGQDCFQEIGDRIWRNICEKSSAVGVSSHSTAKSLAQLAWFCILHQPTRREAFTAIYQRQTESTRVRFLHLWSDGLPAAGEICQEAAVDLLIDLFQETKSVKKRTNRELFVQAMNKLLGSVNTTQFIQFVRNQLMNYVVQFKPKRFSALMRQFASHIVSNEWTGQLKAVMLMWIGTMVNRNPGFDVVHLLIDQIESLQSSKSNPENEDDDEVIILSHHSNLLQDSAHENKFDFDEFVSDINLTICNHMMDKVCTDVGMSQLSIEDTLQILYFMASSFDENNEQHQQLQHLFSTLYSTNISQQKQKQIVSKLRTWTNTALLSKKCIQSVFIHRVVYLSALKQPQFSWRMLDDQSVTVDSHEFTAFLRSEQMSFTKRGFLNIIQARRWEPVVHSRSLPRVRETLKYFSVRCVAGGRGQAAFATVTKTRLYFANVAAQFTRRAAERAQLSYLIGR